jgi:hypothetical protein
MIKDVMKHANEPDAAGVRTNATNAANAATVSAAKARKRSLAARNGYRWISRRDNWLQPSDRPRSQQGAWTI